MEDVKRAEQELEKLPTLPESIKSDSSNAYNESNKIITEINVSKSENGNHDKTASQNNPEVKEPYKDVQEPRIEIVTEESESARKPIPAIKCSQCNFILHFQGNCPQCGTPFNTIINHWRKNI
jgi:hypothetical protein